MHHKIAAVIVVMAVTIGGAKAQTPVPVFSESRVAALGYIATNNFLIGRIGRECLNVLGRKESPQEFVGGWQSRNSTYIMASAKYMEKLLAEVLATSGAERRDAVQRELQARAQASADQTLQQWFQKGTKEEVCKRSVGLVDAGAFDISQSSPMFNELQALVVWAK